jgi:hypothetical protein
LETPRALFCTLIGASLVLGCGGTGSYPQSKPAVGVVPVSGVLTYQNRPLADFVVTFTPVGEGRVAMGHTDSSGRFSLGTDKPNDGAQVGDYRVSVVYAGPQVEDTSAYKNPNDDPTKLPKPPIQIPDKYTSPETSGRTQDVPAGGLTDLKIDLN